MRALGFAAAALALAAGPAHGQIVISADSDEDPYVACQAWFGMEGTIYAAEDAPNDPKAYSRFLYYAEKFAREQGRERVNTDCLTFTRKAPSLEQAHTPGHTYYNPSWRKQVTVARFPGLPPGWSKTPVPGEEGTAPPAPAEPGDLQTITFLYPKGTPADPGYDFASIDVKYRFIACMGEVHAAYSLDPESVRTSDFYVSRNGQAPVGDAVPPKPISIEMTAVAKPRINSRHLGAIVLQERYGRVSDAFAGPALGYGCFTGQSQKVGMVADIVRGKHEPAELDAILNDALVLDHQFLGMPYLKHPLRNGALDSAPTNAQRAEQERLAREREEAAAREAAAAKYREETLAAEMQRAQAIAEASAAERRAVEEARARYEREMEAKRAADEQYARDMAAHEAELRRLAAERAEYERKMEEYRRATAGR